VKSTPPRGATQEENERSLSIKVGVGVVGGGLVVCGGFGVGGVFAQGGVANVLYKYLKTRMSLASS